LGKQNPSKEIAAEPIDPISNALADEPDRGCVLVGAAYIELRLEQLLRAYFRSNKAIDSQLAETVLGNAHNSTALLYSSWAKASVLHLFGIIDRDHFKLFNKIRKLRNEFAHKPGKMPLDDEAITGIAKAMATIREKHFNGEAELSAEYLAAYWANYGGKAIYSVPRLRFMGFCRYLNGYLNEQINRFDPSTAHIRRRVGKIHEDSPPMSNE